MWEGGGDERGLPMRLSPFLWSFLASARAVVEKGTVWRMDGVGVMALGSRDESCLKGACDEVGILSTLARVWSTGERCMFWPVQIC